MAVTVTVRVTPAATTASATAAPVAPATAASAVIPVTGIANGSMTVAVPAAGMVSVPLMGAVAFAVTGLAPETVAVAMAAGAIPGTLSLAPTGSGPVLLRVPLRTPGPYPPGPLFPPRPLVPSVPEGIPAAGIGPARTAVAACGAVSGAGAARRLGRRVRGLMRRGHRPIIARTNGAPCSPRPN